MRNQRKVNQVHHQHFGSVGEAIDWIEATPKAPSGGASSEGPKSAWYGDLDYVETLALARSGWSEHREAVNEAAKQVTADTLRVVTEFQPRSHYGVVGCDLDIDRFTMGEQDCIIDFVPTATEGRQRVIGLNISIAASAGVEADTLVKRGAAIVALIDILSSTGRAVEVFCEETVDKWDGDDVCTVSFQVKQADQHLDLDELLFAIAHPGMLRRICFAVEERLPEKVVKKFGFDGGGYGHPAKLVMTEKFGATIAIDTVEWGGENREVHDPVGWIHDVLQDIADQEKVHED